MPSFRKSKKKKYSIYDELFTLSPLKSFKDVFSVLSVRPESHGTTLNYRIFLATPLS
jgi:hypothetical protein